MCPECRSYCCHLHHRYCFTFPFHPFSILTTLVATRRCSVFASKCLGDVMPERLLFVISRILAGGIPGFRVELCCFSHPLTWPYSHCWLRSHFFLSFLFGVCSGCVFFLLLLCCFWFPFLSVLLLGQFLDCVLVHNRHFCGFLPIDSPACNYNSPSHDSFRLQHPGLKLENFIKSSPKVFKQLCTANIDPKQRRNTSACLMRLNVCNDLAEAVKAVGRKKQVLFST